MCVVSVLLAGRDGNGQLVLFRGERAIVEWRDRTRRVVGPVKIKDEPPVRSFFQVEIAPYRVGFPATRLVSEEDTVAFLPDAGFEET